MERRSWLLPDEPRPVRLMNTVWADRHQVHEGLGSAAALADWLTSTGAAVSRVTSADLVAAVRLRDALRRLAAEATADERPRAAVPLTCPAALSVLNASIGAAHLPPALVRTRAGFQRAPRLRGGAVAVALAEVALDALDLLEAPSPLRACPAPGCVLYFKKDHPRREWCSVGCGNRVRAARHYARSTTG